MWSLCRRNYNNKPQKYDLTVNNESNEIHTNELVRVEDAEEEKNQFIIRNSEKSVLKDLIIRKDFKKGLVSKWISTVVE